MMKNLLSTVMVLAVVGTAGATVTPGYYDSLEGLSGVQLKKAVKAVAKKNYQRIPYGTSSSGKCTWKGFFEADTRCVNGVRCWWDMYSNNNVPAPSYNSRGEMNIEHAVANSWWGGSTSTDAYYDLFHLNPSDATANNHKSNFPLGTITNLTWSNDGKVTMVGQPAKGTCGGATYVYEPADEYKGDFARTFFYMFTVYDDISWRPSETNWMYDTSSALTLKPWAYEMLLEWSKNDPVSQKEIDRNEAIYKYQGNRNPFIDCPELAEHIWGSLKNNPYHFDGTYEEEPGKEGGYWYAVTSSDDLREGGRYIIVSTESGVAMSFYTPNYSTPYYMMECSSLPVFDESSYPKRISSVPDDIAVIGLKKDGYNWTLSVSDLEGNLKGYLSSLEEKKMNLTQDPSGTGTAISLTASDSQTDIKFTSGAGYLKHNNNDNGKRFTTYAGGLEAVQLYQYVDADESGSGSGSGSDDEDNSGDSGDSGDGEGGSGGTDVVEIEVTEDFSLSDTGLPMGSKNKPSTATTYTSHETGIVYTIMGCYVNNFENPYYLLVNGKNNAGAFIAFTLEYDCHEIVLYTTSSCSINANSAVNVYAGDNLIGKYSVNAQNAEFSVEIPEEYGNAGTEFRIESATTSYNQQFSAFKYVCTKDNLTGVESVIGDAGFESVPVKKIIRDGRLLILKGDRLYTPSGILLN